MRVQRTPLSVLLAGCLLAGSLAAIAGPGPAAPASAAAPGDRKPTATSKVFRQPRVELTTRIYDHARKIVPAGFYDITLVKYDYADGTSDYGFELRKPNDDPIVGILKDVRMQMLATRGAAVYLGFPIPGEKKREAELATKKAASEAEAAGRPAPPPEEVKREKKLPIVAPVVGDEVRLSYWTRTPMKTFQIYTSIAPIPPPSVQ